MTNKYNQSKIYRIVSNVTGENYYGSTTEPTLARRLAKHRSNYRDYLNEKKYRKYVTSFKILETNDYEIVFVENVNCNNKLELHQRERYYIENNECVNKVKRPVISREEDLQRKKDYVLKNQIYFKEISKQYRAQNKDKIKIHKSEIKVCECGANYTHTHLQRHLKTTAHKEHLKPKEKE